MAQSVFPKARTALLKPHLSGFHDTPLDTLLQGGEHALAKMRKLFDAETGSARRIRMRR